MQHAKHRAPTRPRAVRRGVVLVLTLVLAMALGLQTADAEPGKGKPGAAAQGPGADPVDAGADEEPQEPEVPVGSPGTIEANGKYGYAWPLAPDCDESPVTDSGCVNDGRGFFQGQCTSWVAHRLSQLNGISFSNWYAGRHWGDADQWAEVAKSIRIKPSDKPTAGDVAWYARGHVAYVESVDPDGSIMISEMNFDGHNGFRMITLYPGSSSWPDKFIHLADIVPGAATVVPVDTTAPTAPDDLHVVTHRGRIGVSWKPSTDAWGVSGYRISRSGAPLGTLSADATTYWDQQVSPGQSYSYSVVAYDDAGNESAASTIDVGQPDEAADRAWVTTDAGPALCGRTGDLRHERLGCTVLTRRGWKFAGLDRDTNWGRPGTRSFVASGDGGVAYCRSVGRGATPRGVACTTLDPHTLLWGYDRISGATDQTFADDRTWVSTGEGPALCGRSGTLAHQRVGCTVMTDAGWRFAGLGRDSAWGGSQVFLSSQDGTVSYCRRIERAQGLPRPACTDFDPASLRWGHDHISRTPDPTLDDNRTWLSTGAGPALCGRAGAEGDQRLTCSVLSTRGWNVKGPGRTLAWGDPASRAFVPSGRNGVSYCRTVVTPSGDRATCTRFDAASGAWGRDRVAAVVAHTDSDSRTWQETDAGPALCGRNQGPDGQRVACSVLTRRGWMVRGRDAAWGATGTFVPSATGGLSYCRGLTPPGGPARLVCTALEPSGRTWGPNRVSGPARLTLSDPF
jgi:hypothetical protein